MRRLRSERARGRGRPVIAFVVIAFLAGAAALVLALTRSGAPASANAPVSARMNMAALGAVSTRIETVPASLASLPADVRPGAGTVRALLTSAGPGRTSVYAWPKGTEAVCKQTSFGSGGCFSEFRVPANATISDPDQVGAGTPIIVWGVASDDVTEISVIVDGTPHLALLENNAFLYELTDSNALSSAVEGFIVKLKDGSTQRIRG